MKNLEQIRAKNAWEAASNPENFKGKNEGETVKKVPTMIRDNGLLGALAFAMESSDGYKETFTAIIKHLQDENVQRYPGQNRCNLEEFFKYLIEHDSATLRDITSETMAYLNYLRRFVHKSEK